MRNVALVLTLFCICIVIPCQSFVEILEIIAEGKKCNIPKLSEPLPENSTDESLNLKRRILCTLVERGIMTLEGDFKFDFIRKTLYLGEPERVENLIKKCAHRKKTPEDTAFMSLMCFFKHKVLTSERKI